MMTGNKIRWILRLTAGAAMIVVVSGCGHEREQQGNVTMHGEQFVPDETARSVHENVTASAANAARIDGTLRDYHFDLADLNSLGTERLDLMLRNGNAYNPLVVYLDLPSEDAMTVKRRATVMAYLKDRGLTDDQIEFRNGANTKVNSPAALLVPPPPAPTGAPVIATAPPGPSGR